MRLIDADALMQNIPSEEIIAKMAVAYAPTIEMPQWIPCSERLPFSEYGESDSVLATCEHRNPDYDDDFRWIKRLYYNGGVWCYPTGEMYEEHVVAWMPLPSPYREGGD